MTMRFDGKVAIVTGAGAGLGRSHALGLAARGAKVVVNDVGDPDAVVEAIHAAGGEALASRASVTDVDQVAETVAQTMEKWGCVDVLINNAGILRDKTFAKMDLADFRSVVEVHLMGSAICTKAVWDIMRQQNYGRIVMTSSASGIYGNFGQANYGAAKMGLVGLMNVLNLEGAKYGIHVNTLAPTAATGMTEGLLSPQMLDLMTVESVTAGLLYLAHEKAPSGLILGAGAGSFAATQIYESPGLYLPLEEQTPEGVAANMDRILDPKGQAALRDAFAQTEKFVKMASTALGIEMDKS